MRSSHSSNARTIRLKIKLVFLQLMKTLLPQKFDIKGNIIGGNILQPDAINDNNQINRIRYSYHKLMTMREKQ